MRLPTAVCSTCHAPIEWARTAKAGASIPLDVGEYPNGNLDVIGRSEDGTPTVRVLPLDERLSAGRPLRRSHFASCPDAEGHRR